MAKQPENVQGHFPYLSTRSVIAGLFVTFLVFAILMSLGMAFGGLALNEMIENREGRGLPTGAAIWFIVSTLLALFAGSYFAGRVSNFITTRVGAAQGLVIASIFFAMFLFQTAMTLGWIGASVRSTGGAAARLMQNPQVGSVIDRATADLNLRSEPEVVAQGVLARLIRGNQEGAKYYLARQANIPPEEADRRLAEIRNDVTLAAENAGKMAANVLSGIGWALFGMMVLGTIAACLGGGLGSRENLRHPISVGERETYVARAPAGV